MYYLAEPKKQEQMQVDVEEPNKDVKTIPLDQAIQKYKLDTVDVEKLKAGKVVWCGETALSKTEEAF